LEQLRSYFNYNAQRALFLTGEPAHWILRTRSAFKGAGPLFVENVFGEPYRFSGGQNVYARQFNLERKDSVSAPAVVNDGAKLWVLGIKTEGSDTIISSWNGARTEVLGGLLYPATTVSSTIPAFVDQNSESSYSYALSNGVGTDYQQHVREARSGSTKTLTAASVPDRGTASILPLYSGHGYP